MLPYLPLVLALGSAEPCLVTHELRAPTRQGHVIAAELATRQPSQRSPTVVLVSGAGAHTRDYATDAGNHANGNDAFRLLRDSLTSRGYVVVRFDERGTGSSTGSYATATTATLAQDVVDLIVALRRRPDVDARRIALLGHSEGAAIAWLVASKRPDVAAVISLGGPAWTGERIMRWQDSVAAWQDISSSADSTVDARKALLAQRHATRLATDHWYRFFLSFDPSQAVMALRVPLLFLHGDKDVLVSPEQASELAEVAQRHGNKRATAVLLEDFDHGFRFRDSMDPLPPLVIRTIADWLGRVLPTWQPRGDCR
ncbi:MAG: alpha/beta fold hydrolase [Gemmatimonadetes bacterium]|nr:alpha/beta fold hydrolase [Gemmatimonadota bacterium]